MRYLSNGSLLVDELAIVVVFPLEATPALLLTGNGDPADAHRVAGSLNGPALALLQQALLLLGIPETPVDSPEPAPDADEHRSRPVVIERHTFALDSAPVIGIIIELERRAPRVLTNAESDERYARLNDWIDQHPDLRDLVGRALAAQSAAKPEGDL